MCTTSSSNTSLPSWLTQGAQQLFQNNLGFLNQPYQAAPYLGKHPLQGAKTPGNQVAGLTPAQNEGFAALQNLYQTGADSSAPANAQELVTQATGALDPSKTSQWMDPYLSGVLTPTINAINLQEAKQTQGLDANAIEAGAFGDARHGVEQGQVFKQADQAVSDATGQAYSQAWQSALQSQQAQAQNLFQGAQEGYGIYSQNQQQQLGNIQAMLQGGQAQQQQQQNLLDARAQQWQAKQQSPYDKLAAAMSLLTGVGSVAPKTTSQDSGMGGMLGLGGSLLGGIFGV